MSFQTDWYAHRLAVLFGLWPVKDSKYEPLFVSDDPDHEPYDTEDNDWNFRLANEYDGSTNVLIAVVGDELEKPPPPQVFYDI